MKSKIIGGIIIFFAILPFIELRLTQRGGWSKDIISEIEPNLDSTLDVLNSFRVHALDFLIDKAALAIYSASKYSENGYYNCANNMTSGRELICSSKALEILYVVDEMKRISLSKKEEIVNYVQETFNESKERGWFGPEQAYSYVMIHYYLNETLPSLEEIQAVLDRSSSIDGGYAGFQDPVNGDVVSTYYAVKALDTLSHNFTEERTEYMDFVSNKMINLDIEEKVSAYETLDILNVPIDVSLKNKLYCMASFFNPFAGSAAKAKCLELLNVGSMNVLVPVVLLVIFGIILMYL